MSVRMLLKFSCFLVRCCFEYAYNKAKSEIGAFGLNVILADTEMERAQEQLLRWN